MSASKAVIGAPTISIATAPSSSFGKGNTQSLVQLNDKVVVVSEKEEQGKEEENRPSKIFDGSGSVFTNFFQRRGTEKESGAANGDPNFLAAHQSPVSEYSESTSDNESGSCSSELPDEQNSRDSDSVDVSYSEMAVRWMWKVATQMTTK